MEPTTYDPNKLLTLTPEAMQHFSKVISDENAIAVKLSLTGGGCAGYEYKWELLKEDLDDNDYIQPFGKNVFVLDNMAIPYLKGSTIDYKVMGIAGSEVVIESPQATSTCGCGVSVTFEV